MGYLRQLAVGGAGENFQPEGGLSSKTSYARNFKELLTHTPTKGVAGGALKY